MKNEGGALSLRAASDLLDFLSPMATLISTFNFQLLTFKWRLRRRLKVFQQATLDRAVEEGDGVLIVESDFLCKHRACG